MNYFGGSAPTCDIIAADDSRLSEPALIFSFFPSVFFSFFHDVNIITAIRTPMLAAVNRINFFMMGCFKVDE